MRHLFLIVICALFVVSCKQQGQTVTGHNIYLEKDSGLVYCYADSQRIVLGDDYLDNGAIAMMVHQRGKYAYVVGDIVPNSDGWTVRYHLYRIDTQTLETKHIGDFAAIHFEDDGFMAATTRFTNPDAKCTADEVFAIRDNYYNYDGTLIRKGEKEYQYTDMLKQYGDSLVNTERYN